MGYFDTDRDFGLAESIKGVVWTAIRHMMTEPKSAHEYVGFVRQISPYMSIGERRHQAWDVRQNVRWNLVADIPDYQNAAALWLALARWLDSGAKFSGEFLPSLYIKAEEMHNVWFQFFLHSIKYILHSKSYSASYANDIASHFFMFSERQRMLLHEWISANVQSADDEPCRRLAAALNPSNRYMVRAKATKKQIEEWSQKRKAVVIGEIRPCKQQEICFKHNGKYIPLSTYAQSPFAAGGFIPEFITSVEKL